MDKKQEQAVADLVLVAQKVIACISRQGSLGFLVEEAFEALDKSKEAGLVKPVEPPKT